MEEARDRSYWHWSRTYPSPLAMRQASFFIARDEHNEAVGICPYCCCCYSSQESQEDPVNYHRRLASNCVVFLHQNTHPIAPPIRNSVSRMRHPTRMTRLLERIQSFDGWIPGRPHPPFARLAEEGFFYTNFRTTIQCFYCDAQLSVQDDNVDVAGAHVPHCAYHEQLNGK